MAVQNPQTPSRENEKTSAGEKNSRETHREVALLAGEPVRDDGHEPRRRKHAEQNDDRRDERQHAGYCSSKSGRFLLLATPEKARVFRNE